MSLRMGVFAKVWMGFKETTREDINHVTRNIRDLSPPQTQRDKGEGSYGDLGASPSTFPVAQMIKNPPSMRVTCV